MRFTIVVSPKHDSRGDYCQGEFKTRDKAQLAMDDIVADLLQDEELSSDEIEEYLYHDHVDTFNYHVSIALLNY